MAWERSVALAILGCYSAVQCGQAFVLRPRLSVGHVTKHTNVAHITRRHPQERRSTFKPLLASSNNGARSGTEERLPSAEEETSALGRDCDAGKSWSGGVSTLAAVAAAAAVALLHPDTANAADAFGESSLHSVQSTLLCLSCFGIITKQPKLFGTRRVPRPTKLTIRK